MNYFVLIILSFALLLGCKPMKVRMGKKNILCKKQTEVVVYEKLLLFDKSSYSENENISYIVSSLDRSNYKFSSKKYELKNNNYLIQVISDFGITNNFIFGNDKKVNIYTLNSFSGCDDKIKADEFLTILSPYCTNFQFKRLSKKIKLIDLWHQRAFPVFCE